jgi:hypothetical protein
MIEKKSKIISPEPRKLQCSTHKEQLTLQDEQIQFQHIPKIFALTNNIFSSMSLSYLILTANVIFSKRMIGQKSTNQHFLTQNYFNGKAQKIRS